MPAPTMTPTPVTQVVQRPGTLGTRRRFRTTTRGLVALAVLLAGASGAGVAVAPAAQAAPDQQVITDMQAGHDHERASRGLDPLHRDSRMDAVAQAWADKLAADSSSLRHSDVDPAYDYRTHIPGGWRGAAENAAQHWAGGGDLVWMWMNSSGHRANMLNPAFDAAGYGAARGSDGRLWAIVVFGDYYNGAWPGSSIPTATPTASPTSTPTARLTGSPTASPTSTPTGTSAPAVPTRAVIGDDRYATSTALAATVNPSPTAVVIASGERLVDSIPAAPLARKLGAPLLLTRSAALSSSVADYLAATPSVTKAVVVGGETSVTPQVVSDLLARGLTVERVGGVDRYATALAVAARPELSGSTSAYAARGTGTFADSVAVGGTAAALGVPVLLLPPRQADVSTALAAALGSRRVVVVGGTESVSADVAAAIGVDERLAGADRYATATAVADHAVTHGVGVGRVLVASGDDARLADALVAGAAGSVTLLVRPTGWGSATSWLTGHGVREVVAVGGGTPVR
ncbi:Putative cell wall binding repeat 2 [Quadrisphaera granulorum]|uniref:Putative cell wall binding repeat protein n=1 Tax=Quadrisphaera granulorum TaxID=317664 RepID=A0A315ZLM4_9ACTN|nr:cell wall-binding repeat-containing protein [Quadrisphaera granulorum]PWJ45604.1 putative cell wall binding repeat protein [Quadrisphaera granulorum]SZE99159.1 Putative cell wall binding repeat 2 [Quadrisphaera granulorum]